MTTEELMKPRYKKIADWPNSNIKVGEICTIVDDFGKFGQFNSHHPIHYKMMDCHPHLFKKLEWWENRRAEEMPEYVKDIEGFIDSQNNPCAVRVFKVRKHFSSNTGDWRDDSFKYFAPADHHFSSLPYDDKIPATESDYLTYKQSNQ